MSGHTGDQSTMDTALTREGSIIGTVSYMSPEQAEGKRVDVRSDIFSFGSVMYEMLTGRRAFEGRSGISTLSSILRDDVKPIYQASPDVPPLLEQIVLRCLPKEPSARWQSMKEIEGALLTLQRQLDPEGHFASPVPIAPSSPVQPSAFQAAASAPGAIASVSTEAETSFEIAQPLEKAQPPERAPMPSVAVPVNGPTKTDRPPTKAPNGVRQPRIAPARVGPRRSGTSPRMLVLILGLIGCALVAGAGIGAWYWWKSHQAAAVAIATVPPSAATSSAPAPATATPAETPPATTSPSETAPVVPPASAANDASKAAKAKRAPKPKADKPVVVLPSIPTPVAPPATPAPAPVATPAPPPPAPPKPLITTPVMVSDALPFVVNLDEDVPVDASEGQALRFTVTEGLLVGDKTVIARGATVMGAVMGESGKKRFLGIGGHKLTFRLTQAEAVDGRKLAVRAIAGKSEDGAAVRSFETSKGSKSKGYVAMQGSIYIAYIDGDQIVAVRK